MKILMLCQRLPYPLNKGEKIRAFHHLRSLARNHEVTLVSTEDDRRNVAYRDRLREFAEEIAIVPISAGWAKVRSVAALGLGRSMMVGYFSAGGLRKRILALLTRKTYDLIFVYSSAMAQYVGQIQQIPIIVDFVDLDSHKWLQYAKRAGFPLSLLYLIEAKRMARYEQHVARLATTVVFVSHAEAALFQASGAGARTAVVPMAVDTEYFSPNSAPAAVESPTLIFTGVMDYVPNVDAVQYFAHEIYPRIRQMEPDVRFLIVGQRPNRVVRRLGGIPGIAVTGKVADVRPYFARAHVAVAPLRLAQGMQTKVLEAMAMGLPVVATSKAYQGLEARPGEDLFVEDDPASFADVVTRLLRTPSLRARVGTAGRAFVEDRHSWRVSMARLDQVVAEVTQRPGAPTLQSVG